MVFVLRVIVGRGRTCESRFSLGKMSALAEDIRVLRLENRWPFEGLEVLWVEA